MDNNKSTKSWFSPKKTNDNNPKQSTNYDYDSLNSFVDDRAWIKPRMSQESETNSKQKNPSEKKQPAVVARKHAAVQKPSINKKSDSVVGIQEIKANVFAVRMTDVLNRYMETVFYENGTAPVTSKLFGRLMSTLNINLLNTTINENAVWPAKPKLRVAVRNTVEYPEAARIPINDHKIFVDIVRNTPVQKVYKKDIVVKLNLAQLEKIVNYSIDDVFDQLNLDIK